MSCFFPVHLLHRSQEFILKAFFTLWEASLSSLGSERQQQELATVSYKPAKDAENVLHTKQLVP